MEKNAQEEKEEKKLKRFYWNDFKFRMYLAVLSSRRVWKDKRVTCPGHGKYKDYIFVNGKCIEIHDKRKVRTS